MGPVYIVNVPLQCRRVRLYVKMEFRISLYFQRFLLCNDEWALWYLEDMVSSRDGITSFQSKFYSDFKINSHPRDVHLNKGSGLWSIFRIYQPTVQDRKELLFSYDNTKGTTPVKTEYTEISKNNTSYYVIKYSHYSNGCQN